MEQTNTLTLPQNGHIQVDVRYTAEMKITATTARQRVSRLVISELGNLLYGSEPVLVLDEQIRWRVPVLLAYPDTGPLGQVGHLDVDIETGAVLATDEKLKEIIDYAHYLAQRAFASAA